MIESAIVRKIVQKLSGYCLIRKRHGTVFAVRGDPDLYGVLPLTHPVWPGRHFELEVKRPGERPTPLQITRLSEWEKAGALVGVVTSVEEAMTVLRVGGMWELRNTLRSGTRLKIRTRLNTGKVFNGVATVLEDAVGNDVKVEIQDGRWLTAMVIDRDKIVKILVQPKTLAEVFFEEEEAAEEKRREKA